MQTREETRQRMRASQKEEDQESMSRVEANDIPIAEKRALCIHCLHSMSRQAIRLHLSTYQSLYAFIWRSKCSFQGPHHLCSFLGVDDFVVNCDTRHLPDLGYISYSKDFNVRYLSNLLSAAIRIIPGTSEPFF